MREVSQEAKESVEKVLKTLEEFLSGVDYFAGNELTIADFSILANVTSIKVIDKSFVFHSTKSNSIKIIFLNLGIRL